MKFFLNTSVVMLSLLHVAPTLTLASSKSESSASSASSASSTSSSNLRGQHIRGLFPKTVCDKECGNGICVTTTFSPGTSFDICKKCTGGQVGAYKATGLDENGELICEDVDQCASPELNNCNLDLEDCVDFVGGYTCKSKKFLNLEVKLPLEGENVLELVGAADDHWLGHSVSSAGDVNGDGIDDLIIGTPAKDSSYQEATGAAYILFGRADGTLPTAEELDGNSGFAIFGKLINDRFGESVSAAGDVNGDGIDDIIIGAPGVEVFADKSTFYAGAGEAYVIYGSTTGFPAFLSAYQVSGSTGFTIQGSFTYDDLGYSVSNAGDVNGDGIADVIVGAPRADTAGNFNSGAAYVIYGSAEELPDVVNVQDLDGSNGFAIEGESTKNYLGMSVSFAGDVNDDGIHDVIVGATGAKNTEGVESGAAYVIYGSSDRTNVLTSELAGVDGFAIYGDDRARMGFSVAYAGDMNDDGVDDVVIGAPRANVNPIFASGDVYIVYGSPSDVEGPLSPSSAGVTTIVGKDVMDGFGYSVQLAGDINGDGISDVIIGSPYGTDGYNAQAYIVYGSSTLDEESEINGADLNGDVGMTISLLAEDFEGSNGYQISVASAGDVNNDGKDDLIVGLSSVDMDDDTNQGVVQVIFGQ